MPKKRNGCSKPVACSETHRLYHVLIPYVTLYYIFLITTYACTVYRSFRSQCEEHQDRNKGSLRQSDPFTVLPLFISSRTFLSPWPQGGVIYTKALNLTANMIESQTTKTRWKVAWHNWFLGLQSACNSCDIAELITLVKYSTFRIKTE